MLVPEATDGASAKRFDWPAAAAGRVALLDVDPDLAAALPAETTAALRHELKVLVHRLPRGDVARPPPAAEPHLGFLVLKGLILREVTVAGRPTAELLGQGDLIRPWQDESGDLLPNSVRWVVLDQALLADLGPPAAGRIIQRPELVQGILERVYARADAVAVERTIASHVRVDVRVLAYLWHVAERFGVVVPGAVRIPLPLTHSVLARLVGARRPTVTTALQRLAQLGYLRRDGRTLVLLRDADAVAELEARSPSRD